MKNRKWLTGPRLANTSNPDRLVFHSLKTKSWRYLKLIRRQAGSLLASDMQQELLHRVLNTNALERSFLLPANPHMGLNCSKERETSQFHLFTVHHDSTPHQRLQVDGEEKVLRQQQTQSFSNISVNGVSAAVPRTAQGVGVVWQISLLGTVRRLKHYQMWSRILGAKRQIYPSKASLSLRTIYSWNRIRGSAKIVGF